jgi:hypothetical protein
MKKVLLSILSILPLTAAAQSVDSLRAVHLVQLAGQQSQVQHPSLAVFENPALQPLHYQHSLSQIALGYDYRNEEQPLWAEKGDGYHGILFDANTYTRTSLNSVVWGRAAYSNGKRLNQQWSENADFDRIYPYVTADTIGGDMQSELYEFCGGYAHRGQRISYGAQMSYQSGMDYRDHDPRPKCTTLNVDFSLGGAYQLNNRHIVALYGMVGKYNQQQSISFMNPRGVSMLYHMTGLGTHYFRFKGDRNNARYDGMQWQIGANFITTNGLGPSVTLSTGKEHIQKQLSDEHNLPLCDINEWHHAAELAWRLPRSYVRLSADWRQRKGSERIYDSGVTFYKEITKLEAFACDVWQAAIDAGWQLQPSKQLGIDIIPKVTYSSRQMKYTSSARQSDYSHLTGTAKCQLCWLNGNGLLTATMYGGYQAKLNSKLQLADTDDFAPAMLTVERNHQIQSSSCTLMDASLRYDLALSRILSTVFVETCFNYRHYQIGSSSTALFVTIGIVI